MPPAQELTVTRPSVPTIALPAIAIRHRLVLAVLGATALTFLLPSAPTYDPWAWIIWGREIVHLNLSTVDGPSWKPLPVLLTTPFALFGGLAPDLWLFVARAAALASVVMVFRLGRRFAGIPGGVAAAVPYGLATWTVRNAVMGNSEGLLVLLALAAVERHLDGRRRAAFAFALGTALLRPEAWPFVGLYGLFLLWREPRMRKLVVAGFAALPALWLLPEWWGSGDLLRAAHRARTPNAGSPAFAADPIRAVLDQFELMFTPIVRYGLYALLLAAILLLIRRREGRRDLLVLAALLGGAAIWVAEVALMTSDGFSGNVRYLVMPAAIVCLASGVGAGLLLRAVAGARLASSAVVAIAAAVVLGVAYAAPARETLRIDIIATNYQARIVDDLPAVLARAGGAARLKACGDIYTAPFQVPVVAWNLRLHQTQVQSVPAVRPAVVFRTRPNPSGHAEPTLRRLGDQSGIATLGAGARWRIVGACR